jgi:hypothetical protein
MPTETDEPHAIGSCHEHERYAPLSILKAAQAIH